MQFGLFSIKVHETRNLAAVWAPFRAKTKGVVDHVDVELFVLHKLNCEWKVTGLTDSYRRRRRKWNWSDMRKYGV